MPGRRLIILMVVLLISLSVLSASRDVSRTRLPGTTAKKTTAPKPKPAPPRDSAGQARGRPPETVGLRMPGAAPTKVRLGSRVIIKIKSSGPEIAAIDSLGVRSPVGPGTSGRLDFIASSPGRFPVTLAVSGRRIGQIEVRG